MPDIGDYVVATKYSDGDPGDHFAIGRLSQIYNHHGQTRYVVVDNKDQPFRANGFRRCENITLKQGSWLIAHFPIIEKHPLQLLSCGSIERIVGKSVWDWVRQARNEC